LKYFSSFNLSHDWIKNPNNLPPSSAGIGKILNIARANEIIPNKARNLVHWSSSTSCCTIFVTHTGDDKLFVASLILSLSKENKFFPSCHRSTKVVFV